MSAPQKTMAELAAEYGLAPNEYQVVLDRLGREPNQVELGVFSVMWSEHCSYKSSRIHLKRFPTTAEWVLVGPGEGAGVVDVGASGMAEEAQNEADDEDGVDGEGV